MQPIVAQSTNAVGFSDYLDGLTPEFLLKERIQTMGVLGNPSEPLLSTAIGKITGTARIIQQKPEDNLEFINDSKTMRGLNGMYFNN